MAYFYLVLKRNITLLMTALSLLLCGTAIIFMNRALRIAQNPILIAIDGNGTRVVTNTEDPIFDTEVVQFAKLFVNKLYNFTPKSFEENVGYASTFFSVELWKDEESKVLDLMKNVEKEQITMSSSISKIIKNAPLIFTIELGTKEITRLNTQDKNVSLKLYLERVARTKTNPYGIEVIRYEENILN